MEDYQKEIKEILVRLERIQSYTDPSNPEGLGKRTNILAAYSNAAEVSFNETK